MTYWVKRIVSKSGEAVTERELRPAERLAELPAPVVGDEITVSSRVRSLRARVAWGNWHDRTPDPKEAVPRRVEEL